MDYKIGYNILRGVLSVLMGCTLMVSCSDVLNETEGVLPVDANGVDAVPIRITSGMVEASVTKGRVLTTGSLDDVALFMFAEKDHYPVDLGTYTWCAPAGDGIPAMPELGTAPRYNESVILHNGEFVWPDGQMQYYPTGGPYEYSFTCISPRIDNEKYISGEDSIQRVDTLGTLSHVVAHYAIDGRQDIIWGTCRGEDTLQWCANYYRYHRIEDGMGGYVFDATVTDPSMELYHLLAAFSFNITCTGSDEDLANLVIDSLTIDNVSYRLMLHVGELGRTYGRDNVLVPEETIPYHKKDLPLLTEEGDTVRLANLVHGSQVSGTMMLYPSQSYKISLYMHHECEEGIDDAPSAAEAIDLGLPSGTKWANMNIGAEKPEDDGLYFAWGETEGYGSDTSDGHSFSLNNYKWAWSYYTLQKYCKDSGFGTVDWKTTLEAEDDAAAVNWGGDWRMPTYDELKELLDNTTKEATTVNGVSGYRFTSNINGKSIFMPAAGYRGGTVVTNQGSGFYWTSSIYSGSSWYPDHCWFGDNGVGVGYGMYRYYGFSVRPVLPATSDREERRRWTQRVTRTLTLGEEASFEAGHHYSVDIHVSGTKFEYETEENQ